MVSSAALKNKSAKFGQCQLDCNSGYFEVAGKHQNLEPLVFQFLLLLISQQGEVVSKTDVIETLWSGRTPTDEALRAMVKKAREALKDDARNPSYIKTIPTKGYLFIPNVELSSTIILSWFKKNRRSVFLAGLLVTLLVLLLNLFVFSKNSEKEPNAKIQLTKTEIGQLNGAKVSTHYIAGRLKNIYKQHNSLNVLDTLIVEDVENKEQLKLVFSASELGDFWWSRNSNRLLVARTNLPGFFMVHFNQLRDQHNKQPQIILQNINLPIEYRGIALNYNGTQLFVAHKVSGQISRFNLDSGELAPVASINALSNSLIDTAPFSKEGLKQNTNKLASQQLVAGEIIDIWPSPSSSQYLLVVQYKTSAQLVLIDAQKQDRIVSQQQVPQGIREGVWDKEGKKFSFTDELGGLFSYQITSDKITTWNTGGELVNGLIADCGDSCFILADTQGLPKLATLANPFISNSPYAQMISSNRQTRSESLPFFTTKGIYFIAQSQAGYNLMFRGPDEAESIQYGFGLQNKVSEFTIGKNEEVVVGLLNDRPFSLKLISQEFRYLNITYPDASQFMFDNVGRLTFYASPPNQPSGRYLYDLSNNHTAMVNDGLKIDFPLSLETLLDGLTSKVRARLQVDSRNIASVIFRDGNEPLVLGAFSYSCVSCFHVHNNYLYYIDEKKFPNLSRIDLLTGELAQSPLEIPGLIRHFSLSPNGQILALTIRQNLQTKLVKIQGFSQVY